MPQSVAVDDAVFAKANCLPEMRKDRVYGVKIALAKEIKILAITSSTATQSQASAHIGNGTVTSNAGNSGSQVVGTGDDVVTCDESNPPLIRPADSSRAVCGDAGAANRQPGAPRPTGGSAWTARPCCLASHSQDAPEGSHMLGLVDVLLHGVYGGADFKRVHKEDAGILPANYP